jgi:hypothetical protein
MEHRLRIDVLPQPDDTTCGPTCLHGVYLYWGESLSLPGLIAEVPSLQEGGTLAVHLGSDALRRGYRAKILTYKLQVFDPTWFSKPNVDLLDRLRLQLAHKTDEKLRLVNRAYCQFLELGGTVGMDELTPALIRGYLRRKIPILAGLSATYLYGCEREVGDNTPDDIRGEPVGHFVVLCGYDPETRHVLIADPLTPNPLSDDHSYTVDIDRLISAIMLGVLTYDAALLVIQPRGDKQRVKDVAS